MIITVKRDIFKETLTHGIMYVDDLFECFTLEDKDRILENDGIKVFGDTAIPRGKYKVTIDFSNRFKKNMIHILNVPKFEGVRIHSGNYPSDTEGCILIGKIRNKDSIGNSRSAVEGLFNKVKLAIDKNEIVEIEIK